MVNISKFIGIIQKMEGSAGSLTLKGRSLKSFISKFGKEGESLFTTLTTKVKRPVVDIAYEVSEEGLTIGNAVLKNGEKGKALGEVMASITGLGTESAVLEYAANIGSGGRIAKGSGFIKTAEAERMTFDDVSLVLRRKDGVLSIDSEIGKTVVGQHLTINEKNFVEAMVKDEAKAKELMAEYGKTTSFINEKLNKFQKFMRDLLAGKDAKLETAAKEAEQTVVDGAEKLAGKTVKVNKSRKMKCPKNLHVKNEVARKYNAMHKELGHKYAYYTEKSELCEFATKEDFAKAIEAELSKLGADAFKFRTAKATQELEMKQKHIAYLLDRATRMGCKDIKPKYKSEMSVGRYRDKRLSRGKKASRKVKVSDKPQNTAKPKTEVQSQAGVKEEMKTLEQVKMTEFSFERADGKVRYFENEAEMKKALDYEFECLVQKLSKTKAYKDRAKIHDDLDYIERVAYSYRIELRNRSRRRR